MKPISVIVFILFSLFAGCAATERVSPQPWEFVRVSSLPACAHENRFSVNVMFRVLQDGSVADVRLLTSSGDAEWDKAAVDSMRQWRFTAIGAECPLEGVWIRNTIVVRVEEPVVMSLGELMTTAVTEADSLHALLSQGIAFETLLRGRATTQACTILGPTDIAQYPRRVRDELRKLRVHEFTNPIRVGNNYVIYVRFNHDTLVVQ